jgi:TolB-like protein
VLPLCLGAAASLAAQHASSSPRPVVAVLNLRFNGEHANVLEAGDTLVAAAATTKLIATLRASERLDVVDSARVAAAVAAAEADGNPCDNPCALAVGRALGAQWVAKGTVTKTSNLVWLLNGELFDVAGAKPVLADSYELKGDPTRMGPAGAHVFAQRVERAVAEQ